MFTLVYIEWTEKLATVTSEQRIIAARICEDDKARFNQWAKTAKVGEQTFVNNGLNLVFKTA
ncbi:MAG: hypothetical protein ACPG5O_12755 [Pseudoalteromonas tetraodonis]